MKNNLFLIILLFLLPNAVKTRASKISSPDKNLNMEIITEKGSPFYTLSYKGTCVIKKSPLGIITDAGNFSENMILKKEEEKIINTSYSLNRIKKSDINYNANELTLTYSNKDNKNISIIFRVSNNNIAFRYAIPMYGKKANCLIYKEKTGYKFPDKTTTFLCPQAKPGSGWMQSKPSYEEEYNADQKAGTKSKFGEGFTFPCLFHTNNNWILLSETGIAGDYCGSHLSDPSPDNTYYISYPDKGENNGTGINYAAIPLPGYTPWRTITIGDNLKPIVETTIPFDVVNQLYEPSQKYKFGKSTWSWILWGDKSMNYKDQVTFIDLAKKLGYEYILIDALWDKQVGRDKMPELFSYAKSQGVNCFVWYNSNGYWNNAPQGPKNRMNISSRRKEEMKWLKENGVKGIKVDFFGGDKQETMKLYDDILSDANEYGLMVIFHGTTIPRGWEKMYSNYVGSEAVLASENLVFNQHFDNMEAFNACLHPFIRNTVGCMEFGGTILNKRLSRNNKKGTKRKTTDIFELATAVIFQNPIQNFALTPNNLTDIPSFEIDFMKNVPTTWDDIKFLDGYPGKYCVIARRHGNQWYIAAINAEKKQLKLNLDISFIKSDSLLYYYDNKDRSGHMKTIENRYNGKRHIKITLQPDGGAILMNIIK